MNDICNMLGFHITVQIGAGDAGLFLLSSMHDDITFKSVCQCDAQVVNTAEVNRIRANIAVAFCRNVTNLVVGGKNERAKRCVSSTSVPIALVNNNKTSL